MDKSAKTSGGATAREAILGAFRDIILEDGYERCRVLDVVERCGVARSTFYEHFQSREDLLRESLRMPFGLLAQLAAPSCDTERVAMTLAHIAENRALMRSLIANPGLEVLIDALASALEEHARVPDPIAHAIAGAQLAVLARWLGGDDPRGASDIAAFMRGIALSLRAAGLTRS